MNAVIVGGSSPSTPALFDSEWALDAARFSFTLAGRSRVRLEAVRRAAEIVANARGVRLDCHIADAAERDAALAAADVVIVQFRVGGYDARAYDETFPHRYGLCGDEGLGAGGLAAAWRTWPELRDVLATTARLNPTATVILLTSPIGILTRCAQVAFPQLALFGICELPWTTLSDLCARHSQATRDARFAYLGVNHLGWFSDVRAGGNAVLAPDAVQPLKYVRLHTAAAEVLAEQRAGVPRAHEIAAFAHGAYAAFAASEAGGVLAAIRTRGTPWYAHAVAPLLRSLAGDETGVTYFLTARNAGYCARFADDATLEMPFTVANARLQRVRTAAWTNAEIAATVGQLVTYETLATDAVLFRDPTEIRAALAAHPWLAGIAVSDQLVADVVAAPAAPATSVR